MPRRPLGREARARLFEVLQEQQYSVLTRLTGEYKAGTIDPYKMMGLVGELSRIQTLLSSITDEQKAEVKRIKAETGR